MATQDRTHTPVPRSPGFASGVTVYRTPGRDDPTSADRLDPDGSLELELSVVELPVVGTARVVFVDAGELRPVPIELDQED